METVRIDKGILKGLDLEVCRPDRLIQLADPSHLSELSKAAFYKEKLGRAVYRGVRFSECSFAKSEFRHVSFYKCSFHKVDLTRTKFENCLFFKCEFNRCDPYYTEFENTEINPASFSKCYADDKDWNKALVLFSGLRRTLEAYGEGRLSRVADYYFRTWQRRRLSYLWRSKQRSGFWPWFWNTFVWLLTGYGERPQYLALWALLIISVSAAAYQTYFPYSVSSFNHGYADFWYFSFRTFFGRGFANDLQTVSLFAVQAAEFSCGLFLIALLVASMTRKLSP